MLLTPQACAEESAPEESTPEESTPEESTPEESTPEESTPEESTPEETTPDTPTQTEATISFADAANRIEFDTSVQVWEQNGITITNNKGSGSNIADYADPARFYKNSELIIAYPGMTKIVIACNTTAYATSCQKSLAAAGVNAVADGKNVTITLAEAVDTFSFTLSDGQVRVDSITVYANGTAQPEECKHTNTTVKNAIDATCTTNGYTGDTVCSDCGEIVSKGEVISAKDHAWTNACDTDCNNGCGETRVTEHVYDNACDVDCNVCEAERTPGDHVYDNACDADCNVCGDERTPADHVYDNACDADCNVCDDERTPADHVYDNACDINCNVCGATREITHDYTTVVTPPTCTTIGYTTYTCSVCEHTYVGDTLDALPHTYIDGKCSCGKIDDGHTCRYDNACDVDCNICGDIREVGEHVYANNCDTTCDECGTTREVGDHVYDNACDVDCNECDETREVGDHVYDNACDVDCNECDETREVGDHVYDNACDADCNVCDDERTPAEHVYESVVTKPTCTTVGYTTYTCSECGDSYTDDEQTALGHSGFEADYKCDTCSKVVPPEADSVLTIEQANTLGKLYASDKYTENKYYVTGIITNVYNAQYGNMYITDESGNTLTIYGTYSADGKTRYDAMTTKPAVGDKITVYGIIGQYNNTPQMKNGWMTDLCQHNFEETDRTDATCTAEGSITKTCADCGHIIIEAIDALGHDYSYGECTRCDEVFSSTSTPETEATISFADKANRTEYSTSTQVWEMNGITVTNNKGGSTSNVGD